MNEHGASLASAHVSSVPALCIRVKVWLQYLPSASREEQTCAHDFNNRYFNYRELCTTLFDYASKSVQESLVQQVEEILLKNFLEAENNKYVNKRVKRRAATTLLTYGLKYRRTLFHI